METGSVTSCWCCRKTSRINRRARERTTAEPTFRLVTTPKRNSLEGSQFKIRVPEISRRPSSLSRAKSDDRLIRRRLENWSRSGGFIAARIQAGIEAGIEASYGLIGPPNPSDSHWSQAPTAHATAIVEDGAAALGCRASTETVLTLTADFRRLVLTFHRCRSADVLARGAAHISQWTI
jgi:hypothetical protein